MEAKLRDIRGNGRPNWYIRSHAADDHHKLMWSREEAEIEFLRRTGIVSKRFRQDQRFREAVRQRYNHPSVEVSMGQYVACTLSALQPWVGEVFGMMYGAKTEANAEAMFLFPRARVVRISPVLIGVLFMVAAAIDELEGPALADYRPRVASRPKLLLPPRDSVEHICDEALTTASRIAPSPGALRLIEALSHVRADPSVAMKYYELFKTTRPKFATKLGKAFAGIHFTLGHEIGHHLLSHGHNVATKERAPGKRVLDEWLSQRKIEVPRATRPHEREHRADALAILLGANTMGTLGSSGLLTASGAFVATLALSLTDDDDPTDLSHWSKDHPSFRERCIFQLSVIGQAFHPIEMPRPKGLNRDVSANPMGFSLQILFLCQVLGDFVKRVPGSSFARVRL